MEDIKKAINKKHRLYRIGLIVVSTILSAIIYNLFLLPLKLVTGGTNGIATITNYLYDFDPAIMLFILAATFTIISFMYLGRERTMTSLAASIAYPVLVKLTSDVTEIIHITNDDILLVVLFAAVLSGVANGLMYKSGYNNGGFPVLSQILYDKFRISISKSNLVINVTIVLIGSFFFGLTNALYAILFIYINNLVVDKVLLGISNNKAFYIITTKENEIKKYIMDDLKHSITTFDVKGGFLDNKRRVLLTVIPSREYYKLTEGIKEIDKDAFFVVTDSYQVEGAK